MAQHDSTANQHNDDIADYRRRTTPTRTGSSESAESRDAHFMLRSKLRGLRHQHSDNGKADGGLRRHSSNESDNKNAMNDDDGDDERNNNNNNNNSNSNINMDSHHTYNTSDGLSSGFSNGSYHSATSESVSASLTSDHRANSNRSIKTFESSDVDISGSGYSSVSSVTPTKPTTATPATTTLSSSSNHPRGQDSAVAVLLPGGSTHTSTHSRPRHSRGLSRRGRMGISQTSFAGTGSSTRTDLNASEHSNSIPGTPVTPRSAASAVALEKLAIRRRSSTHGKVARGLGGKRQMSSTRVFEPNLMPMVPNMGAVSPLPPTPTTNNDNNNSLSPVHTPRIRKVNTTGTTNNTVDNIKNNNNNTHRKCATVPIPPNMLNDLHFNPNNQDDEIERLHRSPHSPPTASSQNNNTPPFRRNNTAVPTSQQNKNTIPFRRNNTAPVRSARTASVPQSLLNQFPSMNDQNTQGVAIRSASVNSNTPINNSQHHIRHHSMAAASNRNLGNALGNGRRPRSASTTTPSSSYHAPLPPANHTAGISSHHSRHSHASTASMGTAASETTPYASFSQWQQQQLQDDPMYQPTQEDWAALYKRHVEVLERKDLEIAMKLSTRGNNGGTAVQEQVNNNDNGGDDDDDDDASMDGLELALEVSRRETRQTDPDEEEMLQMVLELSKHQDSALETSQLQDDFQCSFAQDSFAFPRDGTNGLEGSSGGSSTGSGQPVGGVNGNSNSWKDNGQAQEEIDEDILNIVGIIDKGGATDNHTTTPLTEEEELERVLKLSEEHQKQEQLKVDDDDIDEELERVLKLSERETVVAVEEDDDEELQRILRLSETEADEQEKERQAVELVLQLSRAETADASFW